MKQLKRQNFWHAISARDAIHSLQTDAQRGLNIQQVEELREKYGYNEIPAHDARTWIEILLAQFKSLLIWILLLAAVISYVGGHVIDLYIILAIIIINVIIAFVQEMKAERSVASLKSMVVLMAKVVRSGERHAIDARELVPGDIVVLEEGDNVPADIRLIGAKNFRTIEASLTGESLPIRKEVDILKTDTPLADRANMIWKGTFVAGGFATGVVVATGEHTVLGEIARSMTAIKQHKTHFHEKIDVLAKQMGTIAIASATIMFLIGYFLRGMGVETLLFTSIAMLVSAIPESLPAIVSIVLAIGTQRMAKRNVIIREFSAIETLGAVTTIVTDKTGTLTQNVLTVIQFRSGFQDVFATTGLGWSPYGTISAMDGSSDKENKAYQTLMAIAGYCNNAEIKENGDSYELIGDPTEGALLALSRKSGYYDKFSSTIKRIDDLPFDSKIKMRATLVDWSGRRMLFVVGAPEMVLKYSIARTNRDERIHIDHAEREKIDREIEDWSSSAMRVIALAYKELPQEMDAIDVDNIHSLGSAEKLYSFC
ncbi:cation-translocating P-type ATPase [Olivibacter sitiensis]|uniref:cation-translocating P-type ATPase n=1 Tax=Olivibacter sitiensis TaxID=376470 RepID=UPI001B7F9FB9|nr:HAD-IC family P-type ATPase [Olivibacter sitiensis]